MSLAFAVSALLLLCEAEGRVLGLEKPPLPVTETEFFTDYSLQRDIQPRHYDLHISDRYRSNVGEANGTVRLRFFARVGLSELTLHSHHLFYDPQPGTLKCRNSEELFILSWQHSDEKKQIVTFKLGGSGHVGGGQECEAEISFRWLLGSVPTGEGAVVLGRQSYAYLTQLEAFGARRLFPCIDEPSAKATFAVVVDAGRLPGGLDEDTLVLSNAPLSRRSLTYASSGYGFGNLVNRSTFHFETTPRMSPYLLALARLQRKEVVVREKRALTLRSDFEPTRFVAIVPKRIFDSTMRGAEPMDPESTGTEVADTMAQTVRAMESLMGIPSPLQEMKYLVTPSLRLPGMGAAMENWGLVTGNPRFDIVVHELVHTWWGNLLTCKSWDDIWVNEGFAVFFSYDLIKKGLVKKLEQKEMNATADKYKDRLGKWKTQASEAWPRGVQKRSPSRPIVGGWFDNAYGAASAALRLLRALIGEEEMMKRTRRLLRENVEGSVDSDKALGYLTADHSPHWDALAGDMPASEFVTPAMVIRPWFYQAWHPVLMYSFTGTGSSEMLNLRLSNHDQGNDSKIQWYLPLWLRCSGETDQQALENGKFVLLTPSKPTAAFRLVDLKILFEGNTNCNMTKTTNLRDLVEVRALWLFPYYKVVRERIE